MLGIAADLNPRPFLDVRFGSKADICAATSHVRFTPNSDRESGFPHKIVSALPPKADMCSALAHVCFGPIADIGMRYSITSSARTRRVRGMVTPKVLAVLTLITNSNWVGCSTGISAGFDPFRICATYSPACRYIQLMLGP
jgi:hypothetical protein